MLVLPFRFISTYSSSPAEPLCSPARGEEEEESARHGHYVKGGRDGEGGEASDTDSEQEETKTAEVAAVVSAKEELDKTLALACHIVEHQQEASPLCISTFEMNSQTSNLLVSGVGTLGKSPHQSQHLNGDSSLSDWLWLGHTHSFTRCSALPLRRPFS